MRMGYFLSYGIAGLDTTHCLMAQVGQVNLSFYILYEQLEKNLYNSESPTTK